MRRMFAKKAVIIAYKKLNEKKGIRTVGSFNGCFLYGTKLLEGTQILERTKGVK